MIGASSSLSSRSSVSGSSSARVKKVLGRTEIFHQLASLGRVPLPDRIQPLFKFGLVDLPQRKGRVQPPLQLLQNRERQRMNMEDLQRRFAPCHQAKPTAETVGQTHGVSGGFLCYRHH
ncbi:hypothetical protein [Escherichia coli ISC7]|uniref:Uncharacterized protein n=1 Tax=Escherichia coli ISC7 TaxID=1432555 RepID=W1EYU7_ECOLX|nr:hypothetical protein [Escherichia coli ISC7]